MGTRNITVIINNGQRVVRQYGQWDGYPTTALADICEVIRNNLDGLRENIGKAHLATGKEHYEFLIGKKPEDVFDEIANFQYNPENKARYNFDSEKEWFEYLCEHFAPQDVMYYLLNTRDTGYHIVELIATIPWDEYACPDSGSEEEDIWIEAVNIIDLDENAICAKWHGKIQMWSFDALPAEDELKEFEEEEE